MKRVEELKQEKLQLESQISRQRIQLSKDQSEPTRLKKQTDMVRNALTSMETEYSIQQRKIKEMSNVIKEKVLFE